MTRRPTFQDAEPEGAPSRAATTIATEAPPSDQIVDKREARKDGDVHISAFFPLKVKAAFRLIQAQRPASLKALMGEAFNLLFQKYGITDEAAKKAAAEFNRSIR